MRGPNDSSWRQLLCVGTEMNSGIAYMCFSKLEERGSRNWVGKTAKFSRSTREVA